MAAGEVVDRFSGACEMHYEMLIWRGIVNPHWMHHDRGSMETNCLTNPQFRRTLALDNKKTDLFDRFFRVVPCGPDGRLPDSREPLIIPPQTSVQEALLLLKIHLEGKSSVLPED